MEAISSSRCRRHHHHHPSSTTLAGLPNIKLEVPPPRPSPSTCSVPQRNPITHRSQSSAPRAPPPDPFGAEQLSSYSRGNTKALPSYLVVLVLVFFKEPQPGGLICLLRTLLLLNKIDMKEITLSTIIRSRLRAQSSRSRPAT